MEATMEHIKDQEHSPSQTAHRRIFIFSAILALTGLFCAPQLDADIYQWVDENGVKHYSNTPPDNAGNAKKVFDEYQHDEAADQERVKTDQKTLDALTEEIKTQEQQARVEEQKKLEKAIPNQPPMFASECFSPSYSVQQGRSVLHGIVSRDLMPGEFENLLKLFDSLEGDWHGTARKLVCNDSEKMDKYNYSIKSEARMSKRGEFILRSNFFSRESKTTQLKELRLYLDPKKLATREGISFSDLELISVSSDQLVYVQKGADLWGTSGGSFLGKGEFVTTIKKTGKDSFSFERLWYVVGELKTITLWHLENI